MHHLVTTINDLRIYLWSATKVPQRRVARNRDMERGKLHKQETQILVEELKGEK
jgi:cytidylate kinase